ELARAQLAALDAAEIGRQVWYTRAALAAAGMAQITAPIGAAPAPAMPAPAGGCERALVDRAAAIGARIADAAIEGRDGATWIGVVTAGTAFSIGPLDLDLYEGVAGIAVFLAALGARTGEDRFLTLAGRAAQQVQTALQDGSRPARIGGFLGIPSQLY